MSPIPLIGYPDRYSVRPGETIRFMVSAEQAAKFDAQLVRIICADPNPQGPGYREEIVSSSIDGTYPARRKETALGSFARSDRATRLAGPDATLSARVWPTLRSVRRQVILSHGEDSGGRHIALAVSAEGTLELECAVDGNVVRSRTRVPLRLRNWYEVSGGFDSDGRVWVEARSLESGSRALPPEHAVSSSGAIAWAPSTGPIIIGGRAASSSGPVTDFFNGKIEAPRVLSGGSVLAEWDFSREITTDRILDLGPNALHGKIVNLPARAMTGSTWRGEPLHWSERPQDYGAIHFHEDDLYDCGWDIDVEWKVPEGFRSGIYALRLRADGDEDRIPFVVRPKLGERTARIVFVLPTFTYMAYCNFVSPDFDERGRQRLGEWGAYPHVPHDHPDYSHSTYDLHADGSGICHSSRLRPNLNMRPGFIAATDPKGSGVRHFAGDTYVGAWLEHLGQSYDVVTDEDIHDDGAALLTGYDCLITGSHPEYHTPESLAALQGYVDAGGRMMYLGGNGFYWKIALHASLPGVMELRRGEGGIRLWAAEPGEYYSAFNGGYGGLWRRNGRPPNLLTGVGFSAQGNFEGSYYRRQDGSRDPRASFIFAGIGSNDLIGDFGYFGGGAAGFELDRADQALGTPEHALVLASSEAHGPKFGQVNEELLAVEGAADAVRADMIFFETPARGAVFSVGSITFCGGIPYNHYNNNVCRIATNVLNRFLDPRPFQMPL